MVKESQTWGYWAPAHNANSAKEYHNEAPGSLSELDNTLLFRPISAIGGAVSGAFLGANHADKKHGFKSLTSWKRFKDSMHDIGQGFVVGGKTGWNEGHRLPAMAEATLAKSLNNIWLAPDSWVESSRRRVNEGIVESARRNGYAMPKELPRDPDTGELRPTFDPRYRDYDRLFDAADVGITTSGNAGTIVALGPVGNVAGRAVGGTAQALGAGERAAGVAGSIVGAAPTVGGAAKGVHDSYVDARSDANDADRADYVANIENLSRTDPSSKEYADFYAELSRHRDRAPSKFDALPKPTYGHAAVAPSPPARQVARAGDRAAQPRPEGRFSVSPNWQDIAAYGAGGAGIGALLGALFGKKGSSWRMALLGALLGSAYGGRDSLQSMWNSIGGGGC